MLIYGALLAMCGGGVSCQLQWKTFAVQQDGLNYGAISVLSRVDMTQEGISDSVIKRTDKNPDRQGACLRTHICCIKIKRIPKLIVLSWKEKLDKLWWLEGPLWQALMMQRPSSEREIHTWGPGTHLPACSRHFILVASFVLMTPGLNYILPASTPLPLFQR